MNFFALTQHTQVYEQLKNTCQKTHSVTNECFGMAIHKHLHS